MSPTISITGATGFIGAQLIRHFAQLGYDIEAIGRQKNPPPNLLQYAEYVQADISKNVPVLKGDMVIHTAALASDTAAWQDFFQANVEGTKKVYEAAQHARLFVHISSASVYPQQASPLAESDAQIARISSNYGKSKFLAEEVLKAYTNEKKIVILRPRAVYGIYDRVLLPRILNLVKRQKIIAPGDMNVQVSMTHIDNLMAVIETIIQHPNPENFNLWNVADEQIYTLRSVVESLLQGIYKKELAYWALPVAPLKMVVKIFQMLHLPTNFTPQSLDYVTRSTVLNIEKIQQELAYEARTDFYQALPKLLDWVGEVGINKVKYADSNLPWV